jgi:hypothetical protein
MMEVGGNSMAILQKILEIQKSIEVQKTGYDERHGYSYYKADDTANAVRDMLSEHGVIVRPRVKQWEHEGFYDNTGRYRPRVAAVAEFTFVDVEDGSEYSVEVFGEGTDTGGDKGSRKAWTQMQKIEFLQTFLISENNDSFDSDGKPEMEPINTSEKKSEKKAEAASVAELTNQIGELVREKIVEASVVTKVGQRISDTVLGKGKKPTEWKNDARVLDALVTALKNGEVE